MFNEEEILKKYKLSPEEHNKYYEIIKRIWTADKFPVENPIAIVIGGQTGAGKSGIISYSQKMFIDGNVVVINSDEIKPFHPKGDEIAKLYPELYTKITDQDSNTWTSQLFQEIRDEGYNIIFEGTMKNNRVADDAIVDLRQKGYTVVVRGLAVSSLESRTSILERYEAQVAAKGWGRLVVPEHHNQTYEGMPNTIEYIEQNDRYDVLEIFKRGKRPDEPQLIYSKINENELDKIRKSLADKPKVSKETSRYGYKDAKTSILEGRDEDFQTALQSCPERFKKIKEYIESESKIDKEESMKYLLDLINLYNDIKSKKKSSIEHNINDNIDSKER